MKATAGQKIRLGIFATAGLVAFFGAVFFIGTKKNIFDNTFVLHCFFRNIGGLVVGNNVRFSGINVGSITDIGITNDSTVRVTLRIKEKIHPFIKTDATASIGTDGLMGDKLINISPGTSSDTVLKNNGTLRTVVPVDFDKILNKISNVADNAEAITSSLAGITRQISSGKGSIGRLIYTDSLERGVESTMKAARQTVTSAKEGAEGFKENMDAMKHNFLLRGYYKKQARKERRKHKHEEEEAP